MANRSRRCFKTGERALAESMKGYWGAFVRQGALRPSPRGEGREPVNPASKRTYLGKTMGRPTRGPLDQRQALGRRQ
jgi:hypothetical protein